MDYSILQDRNTKFSKLRGMDLLEVLTEIENFTLYYRDTLNLDPKLLFGLEIEWEGNNVDTLRDYLKANLFRWIFETDGSLNTGGEVKSPKMSDDPKNWNNLKLVCEFLKEINATVNERTGGHIHFGANIFGKNFEGFLSFLKTYAVYENILFRFYYGEFLRQRSNGYTSNQKMAWRIKKDINQLKSINDINDPYVFLRGGRSYSINFSNLKFGNKAREKNTIELRVPNGTIEEIIWQNNVNTFGKLILKTLNSNFDLDYINKLFNMVKEDSVDVLRYNEICLSEVLEFVDLIFDNDLDKFYFLRQYFKNFENNYKLKENQLAKRFIA